MERYYNEQSCWETPYKRVLGNLIYLINYLEETKNATWLNNTYIPNTKKSLSHSYQSKRHMWSYDSFVTQDYYNCVSITVDLVLQY